MDFASSIIAGVIGGIIATVIWVAVIQLLWKKLIEPWIEELLYQDVKIEGRWHYTVHEKEIR